MVWGLAELTCEVDKGNCRRTFPFVGLGKQRLLNGWMDGNGFFYIWQLNVAFHSGTENCPRVSKSSPVESLL